MVKINTIEISPPLLNSSCAWSSDLGQLQELYDSPYTGAVTTRTATLDGFNEDDSHKVAFASSTLTTINSYGYSPHPLEAYLSWIDAILSFHSLPESTRKPFILSITASDPIILRSMIHDIQRIRTSTDGSHPRQSMIAIELNTSCPNIPGAPPVGYAFSALMPLLNVLKEEYLKDHTLTIGLKLPPFVYREQFLSVVDNIQSLCVESGDDANKCPFAFLTCTNTLGNSLLFSDQINPNPPTRGLEAESFAVPTALGGLAGEPLHALSLGNVYTFAQLLQQHDSLKEIKIIGVGGVTTKEAAERMRRAGANVVGCATLFGREGVRAFEIIGA